MPSKPSTASKPPRSRTSVFFGAAFFLALSFAVFWPSLRGDFLWDDDVLLTNNVHLRSVEGLKAIWLGQETPDYFPLTLTAFWVQWRLWGMDPLGYHAFNVLLHALCGILVWRVLLRLKIPGAFIGAALFTAHPVAVASVAWIAELKNTLSLFFLLLAALCYLRFDALAHCSEKPAPGSSPRAWYGGALAAFLLALLSKTSVVMLPPMLLGCAWWLRGKITKADLVRTAPFFLLSLVLGLVTVAFQSGSRATDYYGSDPALVRILGGGWAVWFYLFKSVAPVNLSMIYPRWDINPASLVAWLPWAAWLATAGVLWKFRQSWGRPVLFALGIFFINLLPVLGFFDMSFFTFSRVADHLAYVSLIGIAALGGAALSGAWRQNNKTGSAQGKPGFHFLAGMAVVMVFSALSWKHAHAFISSEALWTATLKRNPKAWVAHNSLGEEVAMRGAVGQSVNHFDAALRLKPGYAKAHFNLGNACLYEGRLDEAMAHFAKTIEAWPDYAQAENSWGLALLRANRTGDAIVHFKKAMEHAPKYADAHYNLASALTAHGQRAEAIKAYQALLQIYPQEIEARLGLAALLLDAGEPEDALALCDTALKINPHIPELHFQRGRILSQLNRRDEAAAAFREALRLKPDYAEARAQLDQAGREP